MKTYACYAKVVGTKWLGTVQAENETQALELANALDTCYVSICHKCSDQIDDPQIDNIFVDVD